MADDMNGNHANDDVFIAQADEFDDNLDAELPAWPKVVGIISIVWGSLLLLCTGWNVLGVTVLSSMNRTSLETQFPDGFSSEIADPTLIQQLMAISSLLLTVILVVSGALLLLRKAVARPLFLFYSVATLIMSVLGVWYVLGIQSAAAIWINNNPGTTFADAGDIILLILLVSVVLMTLIGLIWPVFCLIWFGFKKKTHQDMTGGVDLDTI